jgi:hypothetical protein
MARRDPLLEAMAEVKVRDVVAAPGGKKGSISLAVLQTTPNL